MAYTLFPKTPKDITSNVSNSYPENVAETVELFTYLKNKFTTIETPINIDVKISLSFDTSYTTLHLKRIQKPFLTLVTKDGKKVKKKSINGGK